MITGFNTDIQHAGTTYHVQTEDKGLDSPIILSLVYVGGAILASKRTPYHDLIESGYDERVLTERLQRQHKLICAAIRAGRIADLKRMSERDTPARTRTPDAPPDAPPVEPTLAPPQASPPLVTPPPEIAAPPSNGASAVGEVEIVRGAEALELEIVRGAEAFIIEPAEQFNAEPSAAPFVITPEPLAAAPILSVEPLELDVVAPARPETAPSAAPPPAQSSAAPTLHDDELYLHLLEDEGEFRAGQLTTIKIYVGRGPYGQTAAADASVTIKVLGTTFRPLILTTRTDAEGVAVVRALLPRFTSGRAAIIIRAVAGEGEAELRRIIHQS